MDIPNRYKSAAQIAYDFVYEVIAMHQMSPVRILQRMGDMESEEGWESAFEEEIDE